MGTEETLIPPPGVFEACTRCGHRSYVWVFLKNGMDIPMCLHHFHEGRERLLEISEVVVDRSYLLGRGR